MNFVQDICDDLHTLFEVSRNYAYEICLNNHLETSLFFFSDRQRVWPVDVWKANECNEGSGEICIHKMKIETVDLLVEISCCLPLYHDFSSRFWTWAKLWRMGRALCSWSKCPVYLLRGNSYIQLLFAWPIRLILVFQIPGPCWNFGKVPQSRKHFHSKIPEEGTLLLLVLRGEWNWLLNWGLTRMGSVKKSMKSWPPK